MKSQKDFGEKLVVSKIYVGMKYYGHDSAIFVVMPENKEIFAMATERITRYKHDTIFPFVAVEKFIEYYEIDPRKVKEVYVGSSFLCQKNMLFDKTFYKKELLYRKLLRASYIGDYIKEKKSFNKLSRVGKFFRYIKNPSGYYFIAEYFTSLIFKREKITLDRLVESFISKIFTNAKIRINYYDHEYCHAISSYLASDYTSALLITMDGYGDDNCFSRAYVARDGKIKKVAESRASERSLLLPNLQKEKTENKCDEKINIECSIGGLYSYFTSILGYIPNADEGKVEALAALGKPIARLLDILRNATELDSNNLSLKINHKMLTDFFRSKEWKKIYYGNEPACLAATIQKYAESTILDYVNKLVQKTGQTEICLSGGVFANVIINMKIFEEITKDIFIVPAIADDGSAQGAAFGLLFEYESIEDFKWLSNKKMPYYGTSYTRDQIISILEQFAKKIYFQDIGDKWQKLIAERVVKGQIGALFRGRMEWGPRALGNRSIIGSAQMRNVKQLINNKIKKREYFQPFCPSIMDCEKDRLFENAYLNRHMTCAFRMKRKYWDILPGAIHVDGTARVQFVQTEDNPDYYGLLEEIKELTGYGVVLNTSFNKHGRTIVESPLDAIRDFIDTNLDFLLLEDFLITKKNNQD